MAHGLRPRLGFLFLVTAIGCTNAQKVPPSALPPIPSPKTLTDPSQAATPRAAAPIDSGRRDMRTSTPAVPAARGMSAPPASPFGTPVPPSNPASFRQGLPNPRPEPVMPPTAPVSAGVPGLPPQDGLKNVLPNEPMVAPPIPTPVPPGPPAGSGGFPVVAPSSGLLMPEKLGGP